MATAGCKTTLQLTERKIRMVEGEVKGKEQGKQRHAVLEENHRRGGSVLV